MQPVQPVQSMPVVMMPVPQHNGLAVAGFLLAVVGLFVPTGVLALLGLILSMAALGRPPRLFAILGVLIGLIGVLVWGALMLGAVLALAFSLAGLAVLAMFALVTAETPLVTITADMYNIADAIVGESDRRGTEGGLPDLAGLSIDAATRLDPWGNAYVLEHRAGNERLPFDLLSWGPDGVSGSEDDIRMTDLEARWEQALSRLPASLKAFGDRAEARDRHRWGRTTRRVGAAIAAPSGPRDSTPRTSAESPDAVLIVEGDGEERVLSGSPEREAPRPPDPQRRVE